MTTWAAAREAIRVAIVAASGQSDDVVYWADDGQRYAEVAVRLNVTSEQSESPSPRLVKQVNGTTGNIDLVEISEVVDFTLSVRAETLSNVPEPTALSIITRIRKGLCLPSVADALTAAEIVYYDDTPVRYTPFMADDHNVSAYTLDLFMRGQFELTPSGVSYGTIEHVKFHGTLTEGSTVVTLDKQVDKP